MSMKKWLSAVLTGTMILGAMSFTAMADEENYAENGIYYRENVTRTESGFNEQNPPTCAYFCANGIPITIDAPTNPEMGAKITWTYDGMEYSKEISKVSVVCGGGWDTSVAATSITMNGGDVEYGVFGGGVKDTATVTDSVDIVINDGKLNDGVVGGGIRGAVGTAETPASINVTIGRTGEENENKPVIAQNIIGGGFYGNVYGDIELTINNVTNNYNGIYSTNYDCASGVCGEHYGNTKVVMNGGRIDGILAAGTMFGGAVYGNTEIIMNGGCVDDLAGGSAGYMRSMMGGKIVGNTKVIVNGGTVLETVGGGSGYYGGEIEGNTEVIINGGIIGSDKELSGHTYGIYGGSVSGAPVSGMAKVSVNNGTIKTSVVSGQGVYVNETANGSVGSSNVDISEESGFTPTVKVNGEYSTKLLAEAVAAAQDGDTITLLTDVAILPQGEGENLVPQITIGKSLTLDLAGHTIGYDKSVASNNLSYYPVFFAVPAGVDVTITGNGTIDCEAGNNGAYGINVNGGNLTIENGTFYGGMTAVQVQKGSLKINGGYFDLAETVKRERPDYAKYVINAIDPYFKDGTAKISVTGGTFVNFDPSADPEGADTSYVADGYYSAKNADDTFSVLPAAAKVIDTANTTGVTVKLDKLAKHKMIDLSEDATYQVVVKTAPKADAEAANKAIEENAADKNPSKAMYDISVVKTDSKGVQEEVTVTNQQVTLTLGETPKADSVKVYHVDSAGATEISDVTADGNKVSFIAPSFSTYAVTYTADSLAETEIAKEVGVAFERIGDTSAYDIVLKARDSKQINRFMSADLTFDLKVTAGDVGYNIKPAANINLVDNNDGRYEFNLDGVNASGVTGASINIGMVTFEGTGTVEFSVKGVTTNIVNTAKAADNIVDDYTTNGDGNTTGKLALDEKISATFAAPTKNLTVNIMFNNDVKNNKNAYQDMTLTISGGDLDANKVIVLGMNNNPNEISYATDANGVHYYHALVKDLLTKNTAYTVTVEGAGYRTARYTVTMTADKTLNFWNNVKDTPAVVEVGKDTSAKSVTFLAGDIVTDGKLNIYDLSAVVSYFGTINDVNAESAYAKYDLNRDGKIDSKDVAYVLVSWGK